MVLMILMQSQTFTPNKKAKQASLECVTVNENKNHEEAFREFAYVINHHYYNVPGYAMITLHDRCSKHEFNIPSTTNRMYICLKFDELLDDNFWINKSCLIAFNNICDQNDNIIMSQEDLLHHVASCPSNQIQGLHKMMMIDNTFRTATTCYIPTNITDFESICGTTITVTINPINLFVSNRFNKEKYLNISLCCDIESSDIKS
jgi:hypothetical protein